MRIRVLLFLSCLAASAAGLPPSLFNALSWRLIGPFRGGRSIAVTGVPGDGKTFYFGAVGGGIWKTTDAGSTWTPVFDGQGIASIGAIEVAPSNPNVIYAGSGEADMRSDISFGDGMYKSTDAGKTWSNVGLQGTMQIGRIVVDPKNADRVFAAALGHAYGPNPERGVYRTMDGGRSWKKVLDKGPDVGAVDLAMVPENPNVLYAAMWRARRTPWSAYPPLGGAGSGLYRTTDGGETWAEVTGHGLPGGQWGRVGVAIARGTNGKRVYALIDAKPSGLYRSDDGGGAWSLVGADPRIDSRAWYFSNLTVDPQGPDTVYIPNVATYRSSDGGKTFTVLRGAPGGDDYHQLWIDPADASRMILGSDQGTVISLNGGATWSTWYNQPTAQIYHAIVDHQFPYNVYGSQQDSGTAAVPSRTDHGEISDYDRFAVGGGESGYIAPDPNDPNIFYVNGTYGELSRFDRRTHQSQNIAPWPAFAFGTEIAQRKYRFSWTSPLVFSPQEPGMLYYGAQYVLASRDGGLSWKEISPDLTGDARKDKSARETGTLSVENAKERGYGVVYTIAPSPLDAGEIWAGSDTGLVHLTRDGGKTWANVTPPGLSDWSKITLIEASHFDAATAYAAVDRHRLDDYEPYLYRTRDYGRTWIRINRGIEKPAYLNAVREDISRKGLLFAGTELGVFVSFDDGDLWQSLQLNLPAASVRDLAIHDDDLIIATHGRGFWILDDITPLRQAGAEVVASGAWLYKPAGAVRTNSERFAGTPLALDIPRAKNPPGGAIVDYYLKTAVKEVALDILSPAQELIRHYSSLANPRPSQSRRAVADAWIAPPAHLESRPGMNRFVWDLRFARTGEAGGEEEEFAGVGAGPLVVPGSYQVRLTVDGSSFIQPLTVRLDPRSTATPAELKDQLDLALKAGSEQRRAALVIGQIRGLHSTNAATADILKKLTSASASLATAASVAESADREPPTQAYALFEQAKHELDSLVDRWEALRKTL